MEKRLFNRWWYICSYYKSLKLKDFLHPYKHYLSTGWKKGFDPSPDFSGSLYLSTYRDVAKSGTCPLVHYMTKGKDEKRKCFSSNYVLEKEARKKRLFSEDYYSKQIGGKGVPTGFSLFDHYSIIGWREGLDSSRYFSTNKYLNLYDDVKLSDANPLLHYLTSGEKEGRESFYVNADEEGDYHIRPLMAIPRFFWRLVYAPQILARKKKSKRIAVILHLFYKKSWREIKEYLDNLKCYDYDLFITCDTRQLPRELKDTITNYKPDTYFINSRNIGFDVAPFIMTVKSMDLKKYDLIIKLQSKNTKNVTRFVYKHIFRGRDWFISLFNGVIGPRNIHRTIKKLSSDNNIGMVGTDELIQKDKDYLQYYAIGLLSPYIKNIKRNYHYIIGTCFGIRTDLVKKIAKIEIDYNNFDTSKRNYFSLAHAFERGFGILTEKNNYVIDGNPIIHSRRMKWKKAEQKLNSLDCLDIVEKLGFAFDPDVTIRNIANHFLNTYQIKEVPISNILVRLSNHDYHIEETPPYLFLKNKDKKDYYEYCKKYRRTDYISISEDEFEKMDESDFISRFEKLISGLTSKKINKKQPILLSTNKYLLCDGLHRLSYIAYTKNSTKVKALVLYYIFFNLSSIKPFSSKISILSIDKPL